MSLVDPAVRRRLESCLGIAERGATAGERAAGQAAAERIAAAAGMTLAQAMGHTTTTRPAASLSSPSPSAGGSTQAHPRTKPRTPPKPRTVADRLREKAEELAVQRQRAAESDRRLKRERVVRAVWEAEQRAAQAVRDREWAQRRTQRRAAAAQTFEAHMAAMKATLSTNCYARHCTLHCSW